MKKAQEKRIATADEVLQTLTAVMRQELTEEQQEFNPITGEIETLIKTPTIKDVIASAKELMKRYPTETEAKKIKLEIEKLKAQIGQGETQEDKVGTMMARLEEEFANTDR